MGTETTANRRWNTRSLKKWGRSLDKYYAKLEPRREGHIILFMDLTFAFG